MTYEKTAVDAELAAHLHRHAIDIVNRAWRDLYEATGTIGQLLEGAGASQQEIEQAATALALPMGELTRLEQLLKEKKCACGEHPGTTLTFDIPTPKQIEEARLARGGGKVLSLGTRVKRLAKAPEPDGAA